MWILPLARAYGLAEIVNEAKSFLDDDTLLQQTEKSMTRGVDDGDFQTAEMTDEQVGRMAKTMLEAGGLPIDRFEVMLREAYAICNIARERINWCRHLQEIQNLFHTNHPSTAYATDPERFCRCDKHRYESLQGSTNSEAGITHFKEAYCSGCPDRSPKKQC